jgi:hypothetical protein
MTIRLVLVRWKLCKIALLVLLPGVVTSLLALGRENWKTSSLGSLNVDGLEIPAARIDIGSVWSGGQIVQREFYLMNRSGHQIRIESVTSDCGCTIPTVISNILEPGHSTQLHVDFWPPSVANDHGVEFRRTISVKASTYKGTESFDLFLTGVVEPDASLRAFPVNIEIDRPTTGATLHFKGPFSMLRSIPETLVLSPNQENRVQVHLPSAAEFGAIATKDVKFSVPQELGAQNVGDWTSTIVFAPDSHSSGLTIRVNGHGSNEVFTNPRSLLLIDDATSRELDVKVFSRNGMVPVISSATTDLPLALSFSKEMPNDLDQRVIHVRIRESLLSNRTGTIDLLMRSPNSRQVALSIPVVLLRGRSGHSW